MFDRIEKIVAAMTLEEKAALCTGASAWTTTPIERLNVPEIWVSDGPHGVRREADANGILSKTLPATCFPTASCTASSWDRKLLRELGEALAEECIALGVDVLLGPGTNMKRLPLGGRNFEYFSEDPYLAGQMAASFINGVQGKGVGTSLKHFAVNNQETQRLTINAEADERTLREIYLPAFETAVKLGKPWTVMCAYNKLNGVFGSENHKLLTEVLKNDWGFEGFVVSDWGAVHDRVAALKGGLDLEMPGPRDARVKKVVEAVRSGALEESLLDESVRRILRIVFKAHETPKGTPFDAAEHHKLARKIASEGMVLLRNNGILPLKNLQHIAVIGRAAKEAHFQGGGSSHINPSNVDNPFVELQKLAAGAELSFAEGYLADDSFNRELIDEAAANAKAADVALLFLALPDSKESEGYDRTDLDLTPQQVALIKAITAVQPNTVVVLNNGSPVVMGDWVDGTAAVLEAWMMGQAGGGAIADILFGKVNPSGKLAETFPKRLADTPASINFPGGNGVVRYGEGIFIGYRYYDSKEIPVEFPFGFGMSYTTFSYSNPRVSSEFFKDVDGLSVSIDVTNTGSLTGSEIVQVYVHDHQSGMVRPPKELKGFEKVGLKPGETKAVTMPLDFRSFAYFHPGYKRWITEDGQFDILIGASSTDIRCVQTVTLKSTLSLPSLLTRESTLSDWIADPRGKQIITPVVKMYTPELKSAVEETDGNGSMPIDAMAFFKQMPLPDLFLFLRSPLPVEPEEFVDGLLAQVYEVSRAI